MHDLMLLEVLMVTASIVLLALVAVWLLMVSI